MIRHFRQEKIDGWKDGCVKSKETTQKSNSGKLGRTEIEERERERKKNKTTKQKIGIKEARNFNERNFIMNGNLAGINWAGKNYYYYYY